MTQLRHHDLTNILEAVRVLHAPGGLDSFAVRAMQATRQIIRADLVAYSEVRLARNEAVGLCEDDELNARMERLTEPFVAYVHQHPLVRFFAESGHQGVVMVSDFLTLAQWRQLDLYREFYRHFDIRRQMVGELAVDSDCIIGMVVNRSGSDFSEYDRQKLAALQPHLKAAFQNAALWGRLAGDAARPARAMQALGYGLVLMRDDGRIMEADDAVRQALREAFPRWDDRTGLLPDAVRAWARPQMAALAGDGGQPVVAEPLVIAGDRSQLTLRLLADATPRQYLLIVQRQSLESPARPLARLGLSLREAEVLHEVSQGRTNQQIARRLHISHRTVQVHVARIFKKLGVRSRTEAARKAFEALRE